MRINRFNKFAGDISTYKNELYFYIPVPNIWKNKILNS